MTCARCGKANRDGARFCDGCGSPLTPRCPACGAECRPKARFCDACGASLAAKPAAAAEVRKIVTIVFADLIGSTSLHERLDPESVSRVMDHYYRAVRAPIEAHGGTVVQLLGDGVMCAFGVPRVAEDDAIRAVRAAVGMQEAFRAFAQEERDVVGKVGLRVAVNTGEVVVTDERAAGIGDPLNVAARLQQEAHDGDVLIGEATERLVRDLVTLEPVGTFSLKGRAETVRAFRVLSLERPGAAAAVAFVGRDDELRRLMAVYESAVGTPAARLAAILGSPGVGKSRLLAELARRLGAQATMLAAHCDAAGGGTFAPLADALREHLGLPDAADREAVRAAIEALVAGDESARVATGITALLAGTPAPPEETFFVVRRLLAAVATRQPVVLTIDDVQWAEPLLLDLIEHLVQWSTSTPLLVLVAARPELRDTRSSLAVPGGLLAAVVTLGGLDAGAATRLAANVIGADELPAAIAGRVLATSEGNPLFVGELVRMLVHDGILKREGDRWTAGVELASFEMPPTIHALLAARIERLRPAERTVLERAAVVGRQFSRAAVANLLPGDVADLDARLEALRRSELIEPDTGWLLGEPVMRFHHVLIRDAAYRRVLKGTRAELHERFADWLASRTGEAVEHDETLGWHLEQAHQHLRELGPLDAKGHTLGERAARYLGAAGRRALARDDLPLAGNLLGRALERLDADDPARADLALEWCESLLASGDVGPAAAAVDELGRLAAGSDRLRAWHTCFAGQRAVLTDPQSLRPTADAVAAAAETLTAAGDPAGEAKAHAVQAEALGRLGEFGACEAALDRALAAARRAGDRRRANAVLAGAPLAALWGPSPVTRASGRCLDVVRVLRITQGAPAVEAVALRCQAVLEALRGRTEAARRMIAASRRMVEELGITQRLLEADVFAGMIELLEGDAAAAERFLRGAYEGLRHQGLRIDAAHAAALLGRALLAAGRAADAEALSHESEALAGDDLKAAIAWRGVRAEALARRGEHATAVTLARAAVDIAAALDALLDHADARLALAAALRAAGRNDEAAAEEMRAIELWEAKGATLLAERARRDASRVTAPAPARHGRAAAAHPEPHRTRANAATALATRLDAAVSARDEAAVATLYAPDLENIHHPTGSTYDREGSLAHWRGFLRAENPVALHTPLATLGESLALCRRFWSLEALAANDVAPFGAVEVDSLVLLEVNARGQARRVDTYALDHLGDAVAMLYARYAELLQDGPARTRAAGAARTVGELLGVVDPDRWVAVAAPTIEIRDHRALGYPSGSLSRAEWLRVLHVICETGSELGSRVDEILDLRDDALLLCSSWVGTDHVSGGLFEGTMLALWTLAADGQLDRFEMFEPERAAEALARLDELCRGAPASPAPVRRRVRGNAATANVARHDAAVAARDVRALEFADGLEVLHHPTGVVYDRAAALDNFDTLFREAEGLIYAHTPLATLGPALALFQLTCSTSGSRTQDYGASVFDRFVLAEVDDSGRRCRAEHFAEDHLGDAVARLYARYAELLPDGPARARAAATARTVAASFQVLDSDSARPLFAPTIEAANHQRLAFFGPATRRAEDMLRYIDTIHELGERLVFRIEEILDLRPNAYLLRRNVSGVGRESGGAFDSDAIVLWTFADDGRVNRIEAFDSDRRDEALARFDALTATPQAPRFSNAAVRAVERFTERWLARDWDGAVATFAPVPWLDDRRRLIRLQLSGEEYFAHLRLLLATRWTVWDTDLLATRGERLAVFRVRTRGDAHGVETAADFLWLVEVDTQGRREGLTIFDDDVVEAAYAELDDRYAAGEGAPYAELLANARSYEKASADRDWETVARLLPSDFTLRSHRRLVGMDHVVDRAEYLATRGRVDDLGLQGRLRSDHLLRIGPKAGLSARTWYGTVDGGEFEDPFLVVYAHDGCYVHSAELFDLEQLDAALARYEELAAGTISPFANAASRLMDLLSGAWTAGDWERLSANVAPTFRCFDRRRLVQLEMDRDEFLRFTRLLFDRGARVVVVPESLLATRGQRLALVRMRSEVTDASVGPSEIESLCIVEVDARNQQIALVRLDVDDLDAAYAELDARYAAGEAVPFANDAGFVKFRDALARRDWDAFGALYSEDVVVRDHRRLGWEESRGRAAFVRLLRALVDLAPDVRLRLDHVTLSEGAGLVVFTWMGTRDGGAFEDQKVVVTVTDDRGLATCIDQYDVDQFDAARARFAEVSAKRTAPRIENAATRMVERVRAAWNARDWDRFAAVFASAPAFQVIDRRKFAQLTLDRQEFLKQQRPEFELPTSRLATELIATRGDRLAMIRCTWRGSDGLTGPMEWEWVGIVELDERGNHGALIMFDPQDIDAAYAELGARFNAGEAAPYGALADLLRGFQDEFARHDWEVLAERYLPDLIVRDHRPLGWEEMRGRDAYVRSLRSLAELAPQARFRVDHVLGLSQRACLVVFAWTGTREGGAFEDPKFAVIVVDGLGRIERIDTYALDQLDAARARFAEVSGKRDALRIENLATRLADRMSEAWQAGDWAAWAACFPPSSRMVDRRKHVQLIVDRDQFLEAYRHYFGMTTVRLTRGVLGTRGNRLALLRYDWTGADDLVGLSEIPVVDVVEVDATGKLQTLILFEPDDVAAACAELDARYGAGEAAAYGQPPPMTDIPRLLATRDWDGLHAILSPDLVVYDHRALGWGTLHGPDRYVASLEALVELAPDARIRFDHFTRCERGAIAVTMLLGTREGGSFEEPRVVVSEVDAEGRALRIDFYNLEQLDEARKRFAELTRRQAAPRIETAATRMGDRMYETWRDGDWARFRALIPDPFLVPDRRKLVQLVLDREGFLAGSQVFASMTMSHGERTVLATRGDRLELAHIVCRGTDTLVGPSEVDFVDLIEVDADGDLVGMAIFDFEDLDAAYGELDTRYRIGEGAAYPPSPAFDIPRFLVRRDWDGLRPLLSPDLVVYDHRPLGWETLRGPDAYVSSLRSLVDLAPDARIRADHFERCERGGLVVATVHGTREGGAFEAPRVVVNELDAEGRQLRFDFYNLDQLDEARTRYLDVARACFEELRPKSTLVPPNAASRARDRADAVFANEDWRERFRALVSDDFVFDDRSKRALVKGDIELAIRSYEQVRAVSGIRQTCELIGTVGDRIAIQRVLFRAGPAGGDFEVERLRLTELDADGRIKASVNFDPEDRKLAFAEGHARFRRAEADAIGWRAPIGAFFRAYGAHDSDGMRRCLADDLVLRDHRAVGILNGLSPDEWIESIRVHADLAPDLDQETFRIVTYNRVGSVEAYRLFGTANDGGEFESAMVRVTVTDGKLIRHYEIFDLADIDRALARFDELSAASSAARAVG